ncbi:hypothetical protein Q8A73_015712 [Channa argus]|nr:hypothetical protein Q8A73_015712 [Channa argus]
MKPAEVVEFWLEYREQLDVLIQPPTRPQPPHLPLNCHFQILGQWRTTLAPLPIHIVVPSEPAFGPGSSNTPSSPTPVSEWANTSSGSGPSPVPAPARLGPEPASLALVLYLSPSGSTPLADVVRLPSRPPVWLPEGFSFPVFS